MLVDGASLLVGGDGTVCHVVLTDASVAPRHVRLTVRGEHVVVEDLVAGTSEDFTLDDTVRIGDTVLELESASVLPRRVSEPWPEVLSATEQGLLAKLAADPSDEAARVVYADWLEADGHHLRAAYVRRPPDDRTTRWTSELVGRVIERTEPAWRAVVGRGEIDHCTIRNCPRHWHRMRPIGDDALLRRCDACGDFVSYTDDGVSRHLP